MHRVSVGFSAASECLPDQVRLSSDRRTRIHCPYRIVGIVLGSFTGDWEKGCFCLTRNCNSIASWCAHIKERISPERKGVPYLAKGV